MRQRGSWHFAPCNGWEATHESFLFNYLSHAISAATDARRRHQFSGSASHAVSSWCDERRSALCWLVVYVTVSPSLTRSQERCVFYIRLSFTGVTGCLTEENSVHVHRLKLWLIFQPGMPRMGLHCLAVSRVFKSSVGFKNGKLEILMGLVAQSLDVLQTPDSQAYRPFTQTIWPIFYQ